MTIESYIKNKEIIEAWADGKEIEFFSEELGIWEYLYTPFWEDNIEYRIKPIEEFAYPMWFKSKHNSIYVFHSINQATCVEAIYPYEVLGYRYSGIIPHTDKKFWTQVPEPKKTKIVYEWLTQFDETCTPYIIDIVLTEQDAKKRFKRHLWYKKTGREFEVEV